MMAASASDGGAIDITQFIDPEDVRRIIESRERHRDELKAQRPAFDLLRENGTFNADQHHAAEFVRTLHNVAFCRFGYAMLREIIAQYIGGAGVDNALADPMTLYLTIMRNVTPLQAEIVRMVCVQGLTASQLQRVYENPHKVCEAFDAVYKLLDTIAENA